ncbi:uncharacterized protein TNCT_375111 [Trichonephila clavata]|uniref:Uncharacterized protein n=1 Tax=Trichonephila clavata TaxID=2740835 RepID=A0A8X6KH42_TRICU|nr:uncharacterized protein TNCT_375111 [Trichonephila clavata]
MGRKILRTAPGLSRVLKMCTLRQHPVTINLHREVAELRRITLQISQDWVEMTKLMTTVRDQQYSFMRRLDNDFESMSDFLQSNVKMSLEDECFRNDQRFGKIHKIIDGFKDDFCQVKDMIEKQGEMMERSRERPAVLVDGWVQTEKEVVMKKKLREGLVKALDEGNGENETSRSVVVVIKKALVEFLKEVKKHLSLQREEGIKDMRIIFTQLSEDREEIKNTIEAAFSMASHQIQKNFDQFGIVGREAIKCMAALNEKSETNLTSRFHDFGDKLKGISDLLKGLNFDISSIKQILDNIDGQFDEIYQKLELSSQKNSDHSEEIANRLQKTAEEWNEKSSNLDQINKQLNSVTDKIKDTLRSLNNMICSKAIDSEGLQIQQSSTSTMKVCSDFSLSEDAFMLNKNLTALEQYSGLGVLPTMVQICFSKLNSLKDQIEEGSSGIKQSVDFLVEKLNFLIKFVEDSVENLKSLNMPEQESETNSEQKISRELREFVSNTIYLGSKALTDISEKEETETHPNDFSNLAALTEGDLEPIPNPKYLGDISRNLEFCAREFDSGKTSILTIGAENFTEMSKMAREREHTQCH